MGRTARPLNGVEVAEAIKNHLLDLAEQLIKKAAIIEAKQTRMLGQLSDWILERVARQDRLQKMNIVYPKVGWIARARLERLDEAGIDFIVNGECDVDLDRNVRLCLQFGESGQGDLVDSIEDEQLSADTPDKFRQSLGLPVEVEFIKPNGEIGRARIDELIAKEQPRRAARTVDVGSARVNEDEVSIGQPIVLPAELPEIDLIADVPIIEKVPQPSPSPMGKVRKPVIKLKGNR